MIKLMKLELERANLRAYIIGSAAFGAVLLVFTYFVAYVAQVEQEPQFMTYEGIFRFTSAISILLFGILSAAMYARFLLTEYTGKRLALLFSYPVSRKKIFAAKVLLVFLFVLGAMLLCTALPVALFAVTESFSPIVPDSLTANVLASVFRTLAVSLAAVNAIGLAAVWIGFIMKSVPATLITAFLLSGLYGNIAVGAAGNPSVSTAVAGVSLAAIVFVLLALSHKINRMEVL